MNWCLAAKGVVGDGTRCGAGLSLQMFDYPGAGHFFTDDSLQDHDAEAATKTWALAVTFLEMLSN
jgi:hypothetical protein